MAKKIILDVRYIEKLVSKYASRLDTTQKSKLIEALIRHANRVIRESLAESNQKQNRVNSAGSRWKEHLQRIYDYLKLNREPLLKNRQSKNPKYPHNPKSSNPNFNQLYRRGYLGYSLQCISKGTYKPVILAQPKQDDIPEIPEVPEVLGLPELTIRRVLSGFVKEFQINIDSKKFQEESYKICDEILTKNMATIKRTYK